MTPDLPHYYIARITLEAETPLSIASGGADGGFDVALVRDANGLPAIPGTSLAGVLRHLYQDQHDEEAARALFGWQERDAGAPSRLQVSWGVIQDAHGRPVEGLLLGDQAKHLAKDELLRVAVESARTPFLRERVRVSHRGVADDKGKFDRAVLPAGYRFSAELGLWSAEGADKRWQDLLALLAHPLLRLGGATRAGLGRMVPKSVHWAHMDLRSAEGRSAFSKLPRGLGQVGGLTELKPAWRPPDGEPARFVTAEIDLTPRAFWRIGQGESGHLADLNGKPADLLPRVEQRVVWKDGPGRPGAAQLLVPAASVKGALAHRVAFHANRLLGHWATAEMPADDDESARGEPVRELFGYARDDREAGERPPGQAGRVFIDDGYVEYAEEDLKLMMHNAIDRFTGGVREHMLFMEELVWRRPIALTLTVDTRGLGETARRALALALDDLCAGRLALGGGVAKGHGLFDGQVNWSDHGAWLGSGAAPGEAA
jgi:CRISPR/Cas system CSM-associated protein Csm3 (group 7 of RAMP superfamily)